MKVPSAKSIERAWADGVMKGNFRIQFRAAVNPFVGLLLSLMLAADAISFSSVSVAGNAPRQRRARVLE